MRTLFANLILLFSVIFVAWSAPAASVDLGKNIDLLIAPESQNIALKSNSQSNGRPQPRRKNIEFPAGCVHTAGEFDRENACADWLEQASRDFPADCDYDQFRRPDKSIDLIQFNDVFVNAVKFYRLSSGKHLVQIRCGAGAYNVANFYLLYDEIKTLPQTQILEFPTLKFLTRDSNEKPAKTTKKIIGGRRFNRKTKELIVFVKGRGIGDFGEYARYAFAADGKPQLKEFRAQLEENGFAYGTDQVLLRSPKKWRRYYP